VHLEPLIMERWSAPCDEGTPASALRRDVDAPPPGLEQKSSWEGPGMPGVPGAKPTGWGFYMILQGKCGFFIGFLQGFKSRKMMVGWCYILL
jgi:hypothetical protein